MAKRDMDHEDGGRGLPQDAEVALALDADCVILDAFFFLLYGVVGSESFVVPTAQGGDD